MMLLRSSFSILATHATTLLLLAAVSLPSAAAPLSASRATQNESSTVAARGSSCYPALNFQPPAVMPKDNSQWWCDSSDEYGFLGFSYEITACQSVEQLTKEFTDARKTFNSRYIRLYGACDNKGYYDDVIKAAYAANVGVHALVWFGFNGDDSYKGRRDELFRSLNSNPLAPFVTRGVQFGSEPLFDDVLPIETMISEVNAAKQQLKPLGIPITVSELAFGYQKTPGSQALMDSLDYLHVHQLPFFSGDASTGKNALPDVKNDLNYFIKNGKGKKMVFDENGWPSVSYQGVEPNSQKAVANVASEKQYYELLDSNCEFFKSVTGGGVGWFWHIYSDDQEPGYGLYDTSGQTKFQFNPRTSC